MEEKLAAFDRIKFTRVTKDHKGNGHTSDFNGRVVYNHGRLEIREEGGMSFFDIPSELVEGTNPGYGRNASYDSILLNIEKIPEREWGSLTEMLEDKDMREQWLHLMLCSNFLIPDHWFENMDVVYYFAQWMNKAATDPRDVLNHIKNLIDNDETEEGYMSNHNFEITGWLFLLYKHKYLYLCIEASKYIIENAKHEMTSANVMAQRFLLGIN